VAALALYSLGLLSIGVRDDWRLMHEDNGALHTTLALSHVTLGPARTRAHDLFYEPRTGRSVVYGHHPPAMALLVAAAFSLSGSDAPSVARSVAIAFQLGSLLLLAALLQRFFPPVASLLGVFLFATLPMGAFFGRMVDYEPVCLFAALLQLSGFATLCETAWRRGLGLLLLGVVLGALVDWPCFFFAGAIIVVTAFHAWRGEAAAARAAALTGAAAAAALLLDVAHLRWANHGSLERLREVLPGRTGVPIPDPMFLLGQLENFRRYFTLAGLAASLLVAAALALPGSALSLRLFELPKAIPLRSLLWASGGAAAAYVLAAPFWAAKHAYWQFYFLPFVVVSMLLAGRLVWQASGKRRGALRALVLVLCLECLAASAYMLHLRHTRVGAFAVMETAKLRAQFLAPESKKR
jgi:hypothetical protein